MYILKWSRLPINHLFVLIEHYKLFQMRVACGKVDQHHIFLDMIARIIGTDEKPLEIENSSGKRENEEQPFELAKKAKYA